MKGLMSISELKFLINDILYDSGLIDAELYVKCGKAHISSLPGDLRTNDKEKLLQRKDEIIRRWNDLNGLMEKKYPEIFWEISMDDESYNPDEGMYLFNGEKLIEYYDSINDVHEVINGNVRENYLNKIEDIDSSIKEIDKQQKDLNKELKDLQSKSENESRNFNKLQKEFLDADDAYESLLKSPELLKDRKDDVNRVKELWDNIQGFRRYYDSYEMAAMEDGVDIDIPLSQSDYGAIHRIESRVNENIKFLDDLFKNDIMVSDSGKDLLRSISDDIQKYSNYMIEPWNYDIDEISYLRSEAKHDVPSLLRGLRETPEKLVNLESKKNDARERLNKSQSTILGFEESISEIKDSKRELRKIKKGLKERKSDLKNNTPTKSDVKKNNDINDVRKLAKEFNKDLKKVHDYQKELMKVNINLGYDAYDSIEFLNGLPMNKEGLYDVL